MKATFVKDVSAKFWGIVRLYKVTPKATYTLVSQKQRQTSYVVSSAATAYGEPETYIFPANRSGTVLDWGELSVSGMGFLDCDRAMRDAGYTLDATK